MTCSCHREVLRVEVLEFSHPLPDVLHRLFEALAGRLVGPLAPGLSTSALRVHLISRKATRVTSRRSRRACTSRSLCRAHTSILVWRGRGRFPGRCRGRARMCPSSTGADAEDELEVLAGLVEVRVQQ